MSSLNYLLNECESKRIKSLDLGRDSILHLRGDEKELQRLQHFDFLEELTIGAPRYFGEDTLFDLEFLPRLPHSIKKLSVLGDNFTDWSNLRELFNLERLRLSVYGYPRLKFSFQIIEKAIHLKELDLNVAIENLYGIQVFEQLEKLRGWRLNISSLNELAELSNLTSLELKGRDITDITPLSKLIKLKHLCLQEHKISDIGALKNLKNLETLDVSQNRISSIEPLSNLKKLTSLDISYNPIKDITLISKLKKLKKFRHYYYEHIYRPGYD